MEAESFLVKDAHILLSYKCLKI